MRDDKKVSYSFVWKQQLFMEYDYSGHRAKEKVVEVEVFSPASEAEAKDLLAKVMAMQYNKAL